MNRKGGMSWIEGTGVAAEDQAKNLVLFCVPTGTVLTARRSAGKSMMSDVRISDGHEAFPCHREGSQERSVGGQVQPLTDQLTAQRQCPNHGEGDHSVIVRLLSTNQRRAWLFVAIKPFSVKAHISLGI